ncbi:helix-turn-helix domain-containing protein [Paenibacillus sp. FSL R5-0636]|uniref:helix-turn-helix domain-containing protein n=1 Tax=Paenibacillus TaxID=44249 RepID=UPI00096EF9DF|nr:helix-turn-helix domain-containing protein [Paenibacillus odorifer]OMC99130.1 DNA-binding protein [Paenibacillus odorifer]
MEAEEKNSRELPPVLQVVDIQNYLGIGKKQAYELCNSGQFHVVRVGRLIKVSREVFVKWMNGTGDEKQGE